MTTTLFLRLSECCDLRYTHLLRSYSGQGEVIL